MNSVIQYKYGKPDPALEPVLSNLHSLYVVHSKMEIRRESATQYTLVKNGRNIGRVYCYNSVPKVTVFHQSYQQTVVLSPKDMNYDTFIRLFSNVL